MLAQAKFMATPDEELVTKHRSGCFSDTALGLLLRSSSIRTLILVGSDLTGSIKSTVRQASDRDYYAVLPADCILGADDSSEGRDAALERLGRFATVTTSNEIATAWR